MCVGGRGCAWGHGGSGAGVRGGSTIYVGKSLKGGLPAGWPRRNMNEEDNRRSLVDSIIDSMGRTFTTQKERLQSSEHFPERYHPRRAALYQKWKLNPDTYFILKSAGVPTLTAYFASETMNKTKVYQRLVQMDGVSRAREPTRSLEKAIALLKQ